jgi:multidrug efflux pump
MVVVFLFLRRTTPTIAAGVSVPLALAGTCAGMWLAGFSIDNLSLMALAISVGFVVDDAIVMIENMYRNLEQGMAPYPAALEGARQIGFTVLSISSRWSPPSPADLHGRHRRPAAARILADADLCRSRLDRGVADDHADDLRALHQGGDVRSRTWFDRLVEGTLSRIVASTTRRCGGAGFPVLTLLVFFATIALTVSLYIKTRRAISRPTIPAS